MDEELIQKAKEMGWVPEDQFQGDPSKWVDADEFVERGEKVMPILLANNKRLQRELSTRDTKIDTLETQLKNATTAIAKLERHYTEANRRAVETAKAELKEQLKQAREDGDVDSELDIQERLGELNRASKEADSDNGDKPPVKNDKPQGTELSREFVSWHNDNPWFGEDKKKTKLVTRIAEDLRDEGTDLTGRAFMERCAELYEEQYGEGVTSHPRSSQKVEGVSNRGSGRSTGKTFADLPADAKQACWSDVDDLVGEGKRYKTQKDWEAAYAKIYFSE